MGAFIVGAAVAADSFDTVISVVLFLFILSTINEKFTELVRMYPFQFKILGFICCVLVVVLVVRGWFEGSTLSIWSALLLLLFTVLLAIVLYANTEIKNHDNRMKKMLANNLSIFNNVKKNEAVSEAKKEQEVTALSFMLGFVIAFLFDADLFKLFNQSITYGFRSVSPFMESPYALALNPEFFQFSFTTAIGLAFTGFFLSFGAKFFHDLLDTLLQVKNLKRKANEKSQWDFDNIAGADAYLAAQEKPQFEQFLDRELNQPGVYHEGDFDRSSVTVYVSDPSVKIPEKLFYKTTLGKIVPITVHKQDSPPLKTLGLPVFPSAQIANQVPFNDSLKGTLGYLVKALNSDRRYFLTCYHVVWNGHNWDHFTRTNKDVVTHPIHGNPIGKIHLALKNSQIDAALITPAKDVTPYDTIEGIDVIQDRVLNTGDVNLEVRMRGMASGYGEGYIAGLDKRAFINYPDGSVKSLENLISIKTRDGRPFSQGGDSGALLVDTFGYAIGMLVAGDEQSISLAIPFSSLRNQFNIEIKK